METSGLLIRADSALEVVVTMAHATGHVLHSDTSRGPETARETMWRDDPDLICNSVHRQMTLFRSRTFDEVSENFTPRWKRNVLNEITFRLYI